MLRISPGSDGLGVPVFAVGWEGAEFAGVSGATLALDATEDLSQPFPLRAMVAIKTSKARFIRAISSLLTATRPTPFAKSIGMASAKWRSLSGTIHCRTTRHVTEFSPFRPFRHVHFPQYFRI